MTVSATPDDHLLFQSWNPDDPVSVLDAFFSNTIYCNLGDIPPGQTCVAPTPPAWLKHGDILLRLIVTRSRCGLWACNRLSHAAVHLGRTLGIEQFCDRETLLQTVLAAIHRLQPKTHTNTNVLVYCTGRTFRPCDLQPCLRVTPDNLPAIQNSGLFESTLAAGIETGTCFAAFAGDRPVALAGTVPVPHMTDLVAEIDIPGTLDSFRGQRYGRTVLAHTTDAVIKRDRVPFLVIADNNVAALRIARHVGYHTYGRQLLVHEA